MSLTDVDDPPIAYRTAGQGELVVFLHGLGGSRTSWDPQLSGLSDEFHCVAWDMPGYGLSPALDELTFASTADALAGLIERIGGPAHLVGESFGGMHALHTAIRHPHVVASMVLTNSSPAFGVNGTEADDWIRSRLDAIDAGATPADIAERIYTSIAGPNLVGRRLANRAASFARVDADGFRAAVHCLPSHDVRDRLGEVAAPTLVIGGELDAETPPEYARALAEGIPGAELEILPAVGHIAASEVPALFNELVRGFLVKNRRS